MQEISIKVGYGAAYPGEAHNYRTVKFIGRELASVTTYDEAEHKDDRGTDYTLYQTRKGKLLLHVFRWTRWQGERGEAWYQLFDSLSEIKDKYPNVPHQLFNEAAEKLGEDWVEFLDV